VTAARLDRRALLVRGAAAAAALAAPGRAAPAGGRLAALAARVSGPVIGRSSAAYGQARLVYNERYDGIRPLGVVQPVSVADVRQTVDWSRRTGVPIAIRSGGHSYAGYSTGGGLVLDLGRLRSIHLAPSGHATVGAGARLIDVEAALAARGRAIPAGSCATVGIGGLALGGGVGFASRKLGTTSDNVVSLGIVTADGRYRTCSAREHADLYWACRGGGGGNFGVVTHFELRTHPAPDV
jgi:FAD/FMN-containing dehydrogenase